MTNEFKLRSCLVGHTSDVRCVISVSDDVLWSGSRDCTSRQWSLSGNSFTQESCFHNHSNFVTCIAYAEPSDEFPSGLIYTGSNDKSINVYVIGNSDPIYTLNGHESTVSCLSATGCNGVISGSWDKTVRIWCGAKCVSTLTFHQAAVWATLVIFSNYSSSSSSSAQFTDGLVLITAAADTKIAIWDGAKLRLSFKAHNDVVRGLARVGGDGEHFLSCSNDATVKMWNVAGECLQTYYGHKEFVYSLSVFPAGDSFVSVGEGGCVLVWNVNSSTSLQCIQLPCVSLWSVSTLPSCGDFAVACDDSVIRVFSRDPTRHASIAELQLFDAMVADKTSSVSAGGNLGDIKVDELPDAEFLAQPGQKEGQIQMIRQSADLVECYQWSEETYQWIKIGDVVGSKKHATSSPKSSAHVSTDGQKKKVFAGKEYDFVFDVEVDSDAGLRTLQLPYNKVDDPYVVAQKFIENNDLFQTQLDEIAQFLITNANVNMNQFTAKNMEYQDPFTGVGRYIPGGGSDTSAAGYSSNISDQFTGEGRYVPGNTSSSSAAIPDISDPFTGAGRYVPNGVTPESAIQDLINDRKMNNKFGPAHSASGHYQSQVSMEFSVFNAVPDICRLREKLHQFNSKCDTTAALPDSVLLNLQQLILPSQEAQSNIEITDMVEQVYERLFTWSDDCKFPLLDILRLAVLKSDLVQHLFHKYQDLINSLISVITNTSVINHYLLLRILVNSFLYPSIRQNVWLHTSQVLSVIEAVGFADKNIQSAYVAFLHNLVITIFTDGETEFQPILDTMWQCVLKMFLLKSYDKVSLSDDAHCRLLTLVALLVVKSVPGSRTHAVIRKFLEGGSLDALLIFNEPASDKSKILNEHLQHDIVLFMR